MALRVDSGDAVYGRVEASLGSAGTVHRVPAENFAERVQNDENLKKRRSSQMSSLQECSMPFLQEAFVAATSGTGGTTKARRLAGHHACNEVKVDRRKLRAKLPTIWTVGKVSPK